VLAGIVWALENPDRGIVEADEMDFRRCLEICRCPISARCRQVHRLDAAARPRRAVPGGHRHDDPWQFKNFCRQTDAFLFQQAPLEGVAAIAG
jgi:homospermidine synthase